MDIKEIRERRERLQKDIAAAIEEFEKLTTLDVREIRLHRTMMMPVKMGDPGKRYYNVVLETPI